MSIFISSLSFSVGGTRARMLRWRRHVSRITKETLEQLIALQFCKIVDDCFEITSCWQPIIGLISLSMQGSKTVLEAFAIKSIFIDGCKKTATIFGSAVFHGNIIFTSSRECLSFMKPFIYELTTKCLSLIILFQGSAKYWTIIYRPVEIHRNIISSMTTLTYSLPLRQINHSFLATGFFQLLSKPYHEAEAHVTDRVKLTQNEEHDHTFQQVFQRFL